MGQGSKELGYPFQEAHKVSYGALCYVAFQWLENFTGVVKSPIGSMQNIGGSQDNCDKPLSNVWCTTRELCFNDIKNTWQTNH